MIVRVDTPEVATASFGPVYLIQYLRPVRIEHTARVQRDYEALCEARGGPMPMMLFIDEPLPLPPVEVRRSWRAQARSEPGFGPIAIVVGELDGMMISAASHLAQQLIAALGIAIRLVWEPESGCQWLLEQFDNELDGEDFLAAVNEFAGRS